MNDEDAKLAALLGASDRPADCSFVDAVMRQVAIEERMRAARASTWKHFFAEGAATAALLAAAALLGGVPGGTEFTPILLLALFGSWIVMLRPQASALS